MKKMILSLPFFFFFISCVAQKPYKFSLYWQSARENINNPLVDKIYWIKNKVIMASKKPIQDKNIKLPKLTKMRLTRVGIFRRYIKNKIQKFTIVEYKILKHTPLNSEFYNKLKKRISKKVLYYIEYKGGIEKLEKKISENLYDYNPIESLNINQNGINSISTGNVKKGQKEALLLITYGKPDKIKLEKIQGSVYKVYFYEEHGFFYAYAGRIIIKTQKPVKIK